MDALVGQTWQQMLGIWQALEVLEEKFCKPRPL